MYIRVANITVIDINIDNKKHLQKLPIILIRAIAAGLYSYFL